MCCSSPPAGCATSRSRPRPRTPCWTRRPSRPSDRSRPCRSPTACPGGRCACASPSSSISASSPDVSVLLLAVALDLAVGDPPNRFHPVAWMGRLIATGRRAAERCPSRGLTLYGGALVIVVTAAAGAAGFAADAAAGWLPWPLDLLARAWLLKCAFSLRDLVAAVWQVRDALVAGDVAAARSALGTHLVSRPVESLDHGAAASAAIE